MRTVLIALICAASGASAEQTRAVYLQPQEGARIHIADLSLAQDGSYSVAMNTAAFTDHFLSMRPFKCLEGPAKHWCHVPYPYEIARNISADLTDLEYDFLFVWKGATEYGINMWNGVYYRLDGDATLTGELTGVLYEMDMDGLAVPPPAGELRPIRQQDLHESDPDSHWLPKLIVE